MKEAELDCHIACVLETDLTPQQIAEIFRPYGWLIRKCGWFEYEIRCPSAELILESEGEVLFHGPIVEPLSHVDELFAPLQAAGVRCRVEIYGPDSELLREFSA